MTEMEKNTSNNTKPNSNKASLSEIFGMYGTRRLLVFPALALIFIAIIVVYHTLLMQYARQSIREDSELNAGRASTEIELYISSGKNAVD